MRITREHIGKMVRAESWEKNQAIQVVGMVDDSTFKARLSDGTTRSTYDRNDGYNPWVLIGKADKKKGGIMAKFETFWILWQPASHLPPTVRFTTKREAQAAAEIMTKKHNREFYVMKADGLCELAAPPVKWSDARAN